MGTERGVVHAWSFREPSIAPSGAPTKQPVSLEEDIFLTLVLTLMRFPLWFLYNWLRFH